MSWGEGMDLVVPPSGREEVVQLLDDQGHVLREVAGRYAPFDHLDGGVLLVPESVQNVNRLRVRGAVLTR